MSRVPSGESAKSGWRSRFVALGAAALWLAGMADAAGDVRLSAGVTSAAEDARSLVGASSAADDAAVAATIRATLAKRLPNLPHIDAIAKTPIPGIWELRLGSQVIYSDAQGSFVIEGEIIDTARHVNLTQNRVDALTAFDFSKLPLRDAVVWKQGSGARKLVVFADPNCGYCKKLERDLNDVPNITVFTFMIPILGGDSPQKARDIWCAKDSGKVWRSWMIDGTPPPAAPAKCDITALSRNVALGQKHGVNGTPSLVFENSERVPGILSAQDLEKKFAALARRKS
jgi:thiol:disulfide interchange protein DsbC